MYTRITLLFCLLSSSIFAQEDSLIERFALAQEAVALNNPKEVLLNSSHALKQHPMFHEIVAKVDFTAVELQAAEMMALEFTTEELQAMLDFQRSPAGKSITAKMPRYQRAIGAVVQASMKEAFQELVMERGITPQDVQELQNPTNRAPLGSNLGSPVQ